MSAEATAGGSIDIDGMRLWKVVTGLVIIGSLFLGSVVVCHDVAVGMTVYAVELAGAFAVEQVVVRTVASVVASAAGCDVCVAWAGVEMMAMVNAAAVLVSTAVLVLPVQKWLWVQIRR